MIPSLHPYEEMSCTEVVVHWQRMKAKTPQGHSLFMSPNKALWAIVNEQMNETIQMRDVNTGHVYKQQAPEPKKVIILTGRVAEPDFNGYIPPTPEPVKIGICVHCDHEIQFEKVAVPPRWEHIRTMSDDNHSKLFWICECGCMSPEPKEAAA